MLKEPSIRAWTIQRAGAWDRFQERRVLRGDGRRVDRHFLPAYRWLMMQMSRRIPGYEGGFPVWFWQSKRPDLRSTGHLQSGERGVRLELELPRERVLLSDFETWHCVLNRWHLYLSEHEIRQWERKVEGLDQYLAPLPPHFEAELQATWDRIFDFDLLRRTKDWGRATRIQGVTEYMLLAEVRRVDEFVAR